jgi:TonB family protein
MIARQITFRRYLQLYCVVALVVALFFSVAVGAQQSSSTRKVVEKTAAPYPPLARTMALQGTVRVEAVVAPDGSVKRVDVKGGHPVLAQAAANAVRHWKWEAAAHDSHETVEVKFSPE